MQDLVITVEGAILSLLYLLLFYLLSWIVVKRRYANPVMRRLFFQGLTLKFVGALGFVIVYQFYYGYGDTFRYYADNVTMVDFFYERPLQYLRFILESTLDPQQIAQLDGRASTMGKDSTYIVVRFASLFGILTGNYYLVTTFFFAFFSYVGIWGLYRTACRIYPQYYRLTAIPVLFIPSFFFWGSSLMKDSILVGFLGLLIYLSYRVLLAKEFRILFLLLFAVCIYVLFNVKTYVILSFLPALTLWLVFANAGRIRNRKLRLLAKPFSVVLMVGIVGVGLPLASSFSTRYSLDSVLDTAETTANYIYRISEEKGASAYSLDISYTPTGLLLAAPAAINVTLFRPYLWEVRNPVMLLAALEGGAFLFITLFLIFKIGFFGFFRYVASQPFLVASLTFSLAFAFAMGASTFNFGALARYKIPCLPFYGLVLAVTYAEYRRRRTRPANPLLNTEDTEKHRAGIGMNG